MSDPFFTLASSSNHPLNMQISSKLTKTTSFLFILSFLVHLSAASPPSDPVNCANKTTCTFSNAYGVFPDRSTCHASKVEYPSNEEELVFVIGNATTLKKKMKVVTRFAHSMPKLACPGDSDGIFISTRNLNRILNVDKSKMQITVDSGVTLKDLIEAAAKENLALTYAPYWWGITIGGLLSTGAHGSSLWGKGGAVHEYVVGMRLVTPVLDNRGFPIIWDLNETNPDLDAAKVSLGVLGVISQVTLQLEPMFKRNLTFTQRNDSDLAEMAPKFAYQHEFADMAWFPSNGTVVYRLDDRVPINVPGEGAFDFIGFRSTPSIAIRTNRLTEETLETDKNATGKCLHSKALNSAFSTADYGLTNNGLPSKGYPVIGYQNKMQSSGGCAFGTEDYLLTACPWDQRVNGEFLHQTAVSVPLDRAEEFILDLQKLRNLKPNALCGLELYNGILMRYIKGSSAYLGKPVDVLDFDMMYYRSRNASKPRLYEDFIEEIEQMALIKYNGSPHWGKNRPIAFQDIIKNKYKNGAKFIEVMKKYDPNGLFSNEWSDQILGINGNVTVFKDGCALEGLCICFEDSHCAPNEGYYCKPGRIYKEAMVCSYVDSYY